MLVHLLMQVTYISQERLDISVRMVVRTGMIVIKISVAEISSDF